MSDAANLSFLASRMSPREATGKDVIELGSLIVDDTCREYVESLQPRLYVGVDIRPGPGVDEVMDARDAPSRLGKFDIIISTAMLEHAGDLHGAVVAIKELCRAGTLLYITMPTIGFRFHAHPHDHWRCTLSDFAQLFADTEILELVEDYDGAQIMMKARATEHTGKHTPVIPIYNVVYERPMLPLTEDELASRQYARLAKMRHLKVGVQDIMGATALFLGISLPHRKAPPQVVDARKTAAQPAAVEV